MTKQELIDYIQKNRTWPPPDKNKWIWTNEEMEEAIVNAYMKGWSDSIAANHNPNEQFHVKGDEPVIQHFKDESPGEYDGILGSKWKD